MAELWMSETAHCGNKTLFSRYKMLCKYGCLWSNFECTAACCILLCQHEGSCSQFESGLSLDCSPTYRVGHREREAAEELSQQSIGLTTTERSQTTCLGFRFRSHEIGFDRLWFIITKEAIYRLQQRHACDRMLAMMKMHSRLLRLIQVTWADWALLFPEDRL